jgi:hypothetical protein
MTAPNAPKKRGWFVEKLGGPNQAAMALVGFMLAIVILYVFWQAAN